MKKSLALLLFKFVFYGLILYVALWLSSSAAMHGINWEHSQNSQNRLLWDYTKYGSTKVVLLGDSVMNQTISKELELRLKTSIFNGALIGSSPNDILSQVRLVNKYWPTNTIMVIDIRVNRFTNPQEHPTSTGNYDQYFHRLIPNVESFSLSSSIANMVMYGLSNNIHLLKVKDIVPDYINYITKDVMSLGGNNRNSIKTRLTWQNNDSAFKVVKALDKKINFNGPHSDFNLLSILNNDIVANNNVPLFIINPINKSLILSALGKDGDKMVDYFTKIHNDMLDFFIANDINYVDVFNDLTSDAFTDLVHLNEYGNLYISHQISQWISINE